MKAFTMRFQAVVFTMATTSAIALAAVEAPSGLGPLQANAQRDGYLFTYFTGNGQDGLHLAASDDGMRFTALRGGRSFLAPSIGGKLMRDPSIVRGPDGEYHLVWTTGWWDRGIGIAHSKDLVTWSAQQNLEVMAHEPLALNCWAPEIFYDEDSRQYLIFWATTIPGRFPETEASGDESKEKGARLNHRIYAVSTRDFKTYSKTRLFYDGGFNVIDATLLKDGGEYLLFVKDETKFPEPKKNIRIGRGTRAEGPFGAASAPISPDWVEGPTVLKTPAGFFLFYDEYTRHRYGASRSTDLQKWDVVASGVELPDGARHGTAFAAPREMLRRLHAVPNDR
jgi:hypothetical protein